MTKALVILSGGQDSTTCLFLATRLKAQGQLSEVHAITFNYGQRHAIEIESAKTVAKLAGVDSHEIIDLSDSILKSTSPLTSSNELEQYESFEQMDKIIGDRVEKTFVPMRNALFLTIAANRAVALGATVVSTGVCEADNANYPDCRVEFVNNQEDTINAALGLHGDPRYINIWTPLIAQSKEDSIRTLIANAYDGYVALAFSHTAYDGKYPPTGNDHASVLRAHGFAQAGEPDPLVVRAWMRGLMDLPVTPNYSDEEKLEKLAALIDAAEDRLSAI